MLGSFYDFSTIITYKISDPTNFIILLFNRSSIPTVLNIIYALKLALAGLSMSILLCYKAKNTIIQTKASDSKSKGNFLIGSNAPPKSMIGKFFLCTNWPIIGISIAYALSTTMITIGMNISFTTAIAIFPLVIYGIERIITENKPYFFILFFTISIYCNLHISIISGIFLFLFFVTRNFISINDFFTKLRTFLIGLLLSIASSSIIIINSINSNIFKNDVSTEFPLFQIDNPIDLIKRLMPKNSLSMYSLYKNYFDIAFGIGFLFFIILYISSNHRNISTKLKNSLLLLFMLIGTATSTFRYLFNGLSKSASGEIHYGYLIVFFMLYLSFDVINNLNVIIHKSVILSGIISCLIIVCTMIFSSNYDNNSSFIIALEFIFGYFILTLLYTGKNMTQSIFKLVFFALLLVEIIPNYYINTKTIGTYYVSQRIYRIKELEEYETAKLIHQNEPNAKIYVKSTFNTNSTPFSESFNGYDYILSRDALSDSNLQYIGQYTTNEDPNGINIYQNKYCMPCAIYDDSIKNYIYDKNKPFETANILTCTYMNNEKIFNIGECDARYQESYDGSTLSFIINTNINGDLYFKANSVNHLGESSNNEERQATQENASISFLNDNYSYQIASFNNQVLDNIYNTSNLVINHNHFSKPLTINSSHNGYLSLGIPCIASVDVYVNGNKTKQTGFIDDNSLIPIKEGENTIEIKYNPIFIIIGIIISILGLITTIFLKLLKKDYNEKKYIQSISYHVRNNYVYYSCFLVVTVLFIMCQMIVSGYPFGTRPIITGDGLTEIYSPMVGHINDIKSGHFISLFNFNIAGFKDLYRTVMNDLTTPWMLIYYYFLPKSLYLFSFTIRFFLTFILSGFSIIFYLTHRENHRFYKSDSRLITLGLMYTLCSYISIFFSYEAFKYTCYLPLIILGLEKMVYHNKKALYICSLTLMMLYDPYHAFLLCEFIFIFYFTMTFSGFKDFMKKSIRFGICSVAAAGLSAFSLISFLSFTSNSAYIEADTANASIFKSFTNYFTVLSNYRNSNIFGAVSQDNSNSAIYVGMILIFIIPLYALCKKLTVKSRMKLVLLSIILYISFNNELLNYVFHGFHFQSLCPNRHAIFFVFIIISMLATILYNIKDYSISSIQGTIVIGSIIFIFLYIINKDISIFSLIVSITILSSFIILILYSSFKKTSCSTIFKRMLYITIVDLIINFIILFPNQISSNSDLLTEANKINKIAENIPEMKKFNHLTEYLGYHPLYYTLGDVTDIHTLSYFSSGYTNDMINRINTYNLPVGLNSMDYHGGNPLADIMLNIKYHIEDINDESAYSTYNKIFTYNNYNVYENPYYVSMGMVFENKNKIKEVDIKDYNEDDSRDSIDYQNDFIEAMGSSPIYKKIPCEHYINGSEYDNTKNYYYFGEIYNFKKDNTKEQKYVPVYIKINDKINGKIYASVGENVYFIGEVTESNHELMIDYPLESVTENDNFTPIIAILDEDNLRLLHDHLSENILTDLSEDGKNIYAKLNSKKDGTLYISLPYYDSWDIYIDNKLVEKERFLGGIGVDITKGTHTLQMCYQPTGARTGIIISTITLFLIIIYSIINHKKKHKK